MIELSDFKVIVDGIFPGLSRDAEPAEALQYVGCSFEGAYTRDMIANELRARMTRAVAKGQKRAAQHVKSLIDELVRTHETDGAKRDPYYEILCVIRDALRSGSFDEQCIVDWPSIIKAAIDASEWNGEIHLPLYRSTNVVQIASAGAEKRLGRIGASGARDHISTEKNMAAIANRIEQAVARMGGVEVLRRLGGALDSMFHSNMGRYIEKEIFEFGAEKLRARIPYNYLLNMAVKCPIARKPMRKSDEDWTNLVGLSKDFALLYRVQSANYMENMFASEETLFPLLRRISVRDALFSPLQLRAGDVVPILRGLLNSASKLPRVNSAAICDGNKTVAVIESILRLASTREPKRLTLREIANECSDLPFKNVSDIVNEVLSHYPGACNQNFLLPDIVPDPSLPREKRSGANFTDRPLISLGKEEYILPPLSFSTPAMLEAVLEQLRTAKVDDCMGGAIEDFLLETLSKCGVMVSTGKYKAGGKTWECDIVIETERRVIFLEVKKKSLTRAARAGMESALLIDIAASLVSATLQAMRHEEQLRKGPLVLELKDGTSKIINLNGREVERFAVTLHDYGGFQDRFLLQAILDVQMRLMFSTDDLDCKKKIEQINRDMDELRNINNRLWVLEGCPDVWRPFNRSWFLSVPQILILLDGVTDADKFEVELRRTRQMTTGHKDFYVDLSFARELDVLGAQ